MKLVAPLLLFFAVFLLCLGLVAVPSCSGIDCKDPKNGSSAKCAIESAVVDCTMSAAKDLIAQHGADVFRFFTSAGIDWTAIEKALKDLVVPEAICVLETAWDRYTAPPAAEGSGSGSGSAPVKLTKPEDVSADKAKKDALAGKLWPGKTAKLR
jgi:hypothetical protein